jgi:hypothetical protein
VGYIAPNECLLVYSVLTFLLKAKITAKKETFSASNSEPVDNIQFPTVTICNDFPADRWAYLRNLMNLIDFKCEEEFSEPCTKAEEIADFFGAVWYENWLGKVHRPLAYREWKYWFQQISVQMMGHIMVTGRNFKYSYSKICKSLNHLFSVNEVPYSLRRESIQLQLLFNKLQGNMNNYNILERIGIDINDPNSLFDLNLTATEVGLLQTDYTACGDDEIFMYTMLSLLFPMPGRLGTVYTGLRKHKFLTVSDWWFSPAKVSEKFAFTDEPNSTAFCVSILNKLTRNDNLNVSVYDVSAILTSCKPLFSLEKSARQFRLTPAKKTPAKKVPVRLGEMKNENSLLSFGCFGSAG